MNFNADLFSLDVSEGGRWKVVVWRSHDKTVFRA